MYDLSRRKFLSSAAATSGALSLAGITGCTSPAPEKPSAVKAARNHPLDGIERENIKITDVKVRLFSCKIPPEKWWFGAGVTTLTEVYTDSGIVGIGGPSPYGGPEPVKKYTEEFKIALDNSSVNFKK